MASYRVFIKRSAQKEIRALPTKKIRAAIVGKIRALAENPRPPGCVKLTGTDKYRLRQGSYRILYAIDDGRVIVAIVRGAHRRSAYR